MSCFCESDSSRHKKYKEKHKIFSYEEPKKLNIHDIHDMNFHLVHKPLCIFHPSNEITNFCINPSCYMPLCPVCVEEHLETHKQDPHFESHIRTYEHVRSSSIHNLKELLGKMHSEKISLEKYRPYPESLKFQLLSDLQNSKSKVIGMIDMFYEEIQREIENEMLRTHLFVNVNENLKEINHRAEDLSKTLDTIQKGGQKSLKKLIILHNKKIYEDNSLFVDSLARSIRNSGSASLKLEENIQELQNLPILLQKYLRVIPFSGETLKTVSTDAPLNFTRHNNYDNPRFALSTHYIPPLQGNSLRGMVISDAKIPVMDRNGGMMDPRRSYPYPVRYPSSGPAPGRAPGLIQSHLF